MKSTEAYVDRLYKTAEKKKAKKAALKIVDSIFKLRDEVIKAESNEIADSYRGYLMGLEEEMAQRFEDFAKSLGIS